MAIELAREHFNLSETERPCPGSRPSTGTRSSIGFTALTKGVRVNGGRGPRSGIPFLAGPTSALSSAVRLLETLVKSKTLRCSWTGWTGP